jgi:hypothetical protein
MPGETGTGGAARVRAFLASLARAARSSPAVSIQIAVVVFFIVRMALGGQIWILWQWTLFAVHALQFPFSMWKVDGPATLLLSLSYAGKLLLALAPTAMLIAGAPRWRILACVFAGLVLAASVAFVRACPSVGHWVALVLLSGLGVVLVRHRFQRWAVGLPLIVLLAVPASRHGNTWGGGTDLAARCAANDGQRPTNVEASQFVARYYGVHFFPPDWILLTGETPADGRFMNLPHGGQGSWWLRKQADGRLSIEGRSQATGNIWTSCLLGGDGWFVRAGRFMYVRPPGADGGETVRSIPFRLGGFDAPDTACDERTGSVYASDLLDGRLVELSPRTGGKPERRADSVSVRGGILSMRESDGRLVMLDFQDLVVYAPEESRVLERTPAAIASSSLTLCQSDGAVAVPDLAGRLRVFRMNADGGYDFDWGVPLFAPRAAEFSPDCAFLGVTSADDRHVWIIERDSRKVVRTFNLGPAIRGAAFVGPRELVVADACTASVLRF